MMNISPISSFLPLIVLSSQLLQQHSRPEYQCRFAWQQGSMAFWDNRAVQYYAASDYYRHQRVLRSVTVSGDQPYYAPALGHLGV